MKDRNFQEENIKEIYVSVETDVNLKNIKKNDVLIFDTNKKVLKNEDIYLVNFKIDDIERVLFGEYNKKLDCFILAENLNKNPIAALKKDKAIEIIGKLVKLTRKYDI